MSPLIDEGGAVSTAASLTRSGVNLHDTCVWPGCRTTPEDTDLPLCEQHAQRVHDRVQSRRMRPASRTDRPGIVYYLLLGDRVKIGFTTKLAARLRDYPPHARLLATEPGDKPLEAQRHRELRHSLAGGREWFAHSDEVKARITAVVEKHGPPKVVEPPRSRRPRPRERFPVTVTRLDV